jgi:RHS repeat-associated protein
LTDTFGNVIKNYNYDAFGNEKNADLNELMYSDTGQYFDKETGNMYLRARYYDFKIGRFISEDSVWKELYSVYENTISRKRSC